jgi:rubredoxin
MTTPPIHYIYKSSKGFQRDYFACDADPNTGFSQAANDWDLVTCPDCLAQKPSPRPPEEPPLPLAVTKALSDAPDLLTTTHLLRWLREHPDVFEAAVKAVRGESKGSWEEDRIHVDSELSEDPVPCWYFSTPDSPRKWKVIADPRGFFRVRLGLVGPRWEEHGQRWWVSMWKSDTLDDAKRLVERQEGPPPAVEGPKP